MYAIIDTGNQQERVEVGTVIEVDYIADAKKGDKVKFDKVLLLSDGKTPHVGQPHIKKAYVSGKVVSQDKKDKVYKDFEACHFEIIGVVTSSITKH